MHTAQAQTYDPHDVEVINNLIRNNGLKATPNAPETWMFATWNDETPKKIIELEVYGKYLKGSAVFNGLTTLQSMDCSYNYLTKVDVTGCKQLQYLNCSDNQLTNIGLTNCSSLSGISIISNDLTKLDLTNCSSLYHINCAQNGISEINMTGVGHLLTISGPYYGLSFTLYKNKEDRYCSLPISLNEPAFYEYVYDTDPTFSTISTAISYKNGVIESSDKTVNYVSVKIKPIGMEGDCPYPYPCYLKAPVFLTYSDSVVDINEQGKEDLKIYLNNDKLFIECDTYTPTATQLTIKLYDMLGKEVLTRSVNMLNNRMEINISHLTRGSYIVNVFSESKLNRKY